ncbi:MAG: DUF2283 domain-containing protein [Armatimonadetes bacterium]|nr:DUF2283 domain-containing protein [Armatimonadota bacterium]
MKIEYDPEVDALYIEFRAVSPVYSLDIEEGVTVDLDDKNHIVGIEILDASEKLRDQLHRIELSGLPLWELPERKSLSSLKPGQPGL